MSGWYPLEKNFRVEESCEGITDPFVNCNALDYKLVIQTTSGNLRIKLKSADILPAAKE